MPEANAKIEDSVDIDMDQALAEVSDSLFGQEEEGGDPVLSTEGQDVAAVETQDAVTPAPKDAPVVEVKPEGDNSAAVVETGAPKTWTKEAIAEWAAVPPRVQQEILKREDDMFRGMEQYKEKADLGTQYDKVVEPYRAALTAEGVNPVELFNNFAANHYLLARGTDEQKIEIAANLMQHYGIDPSALIMRLGNQPQVDPQFKALEQKFQGLEQQLNQRQQQEANQQKAQFDQQVEAFSNDPKNIHFQDVASDMATLLKVGVANSLEQAYEMAVYQNPVTRAQELDRLAQERDQALKAENERKVADARKAQGADVKSSTKTRDGTVPVGSIDDTLEETMAQIKARG